MTEIILTMQCPFCGKEHSVTTTEEQYAEYCGGELAQNAFADLSATEREQIISHLCPQCQKTVFGKQGLTIVTPLWYNEFIKGKGMLVMKRLLKIVVWFFVINFSVCNEIWQKPVDYWWIIAIFVLIISILISD